MQLTTGILTATEIKNPKAERLSKFCAYVCVCVYVEGGWRTIKAAAPLQHFYETEVEQVG